MAKYLGTITTDIRGKLGGIVYSAHKGQTTMRSKRIPVHANNGNTPVSITMFSSAAQYWLQAPASQTYPCVFFAAYFYFLKGLNPDLLSTFTSQVFTACFINGQTLGVLPDFSAFDSQPAPPLATSAELSWDGSVLSATAFIGDVAYAGTWILSAIVTRVGPVAAPPTSGYATLGGAVHTTGLDVTAAWLAAFGQPPTVGQKVFLKIDSLWDEILMTEGSSFINTAISG